nr:ATP-binding protein [Prevotella sp.]
MEIKRDLYLEELVSRMHNGMIKIITGLRRCGKSYLLFNIFYQYLKRQGVDDDHIVKVDLEDRRNQNLRDPDVLMSYIDGRMKDDSVYYILLDEVQNVKEFEDVLNSYLKISNADVYVTGSNSKFLSKDVITQFRGRGDEIKISPLSFKEFYSIFEGTKEDALSEYLAYGGLPMIPSIKDENHKIKYLQDLFSTTYLKDIRERYNIQNEEISELIDVIVSSTGSLINPRKIENTFKSVENIKLSDKTIKSYLGILQDVFLVEKAIRYDIKGRKYIGTPAKYYFSDLGLRNARLNFRQNEVTHQIENMIYNELRIRGLAVDVGSIWLDYKDENGSSKRKQLEVDFVCNLGSHRCYIQSAYHLSDEAKRNQEIRSLCQIDDSFMKFVITDDPIKTYQDDNGVVFMNIFDFLLDKESLKV